MTLYEHYNPQPTIKIGEGTWFFNKIHNYYMVLAQVDFGKYALISFNYGANRYCKPIQPIDSYNITYNEMLDMLGNRANLLQQF